jgi:hypothetical protein
VIVGQTAVSSTPGASGVLPSLRKMRGELGTRPYARFIRKSDIVIRSLISDGEYAAI